MPNKEYRGQEPIRLVKRKIPPMASKKYANVPVMIFVK
jgi:hypothetical protein